MKQSLALLFAAVSLAPNGWAAVITFDDINTGGTLVSIPNGYAGSNWSNFDAHSGSDIPLSGYTAGLVSSPNDAFNSGGTPSSLSSITPFSFVSGYFTGAWNDGLNITIQGLNGANILDSMTIIVSSTAPTLETFNWTGLTQVTFNSFGGTPNPRYASTGSGTHFVLDNLTINACSGTSHGSTGSNCAARNCLPAWPCKVKSII